MSASHLVLVRHNPEPQASGFERALKLTKELNRHTEASAAAIMQQWLEDGVITEREQRALYAYFGWAWGE